MRFFKDPGIKKTGGAVESDFIDFGYLKRVEFVSCPPLFNARRDIWDL
jgi:hypothetical protein